MNRTAYRASLLSREVLEHMSNNFRNLHLRQTDWRDSARRAGSSVEFTAQLDLRRGTVRVHRLQIFQSTWVTKPIMSRFHHRVLLMSWNETLTMDHKTQFIADYLKELFSFTELCKSLLDLNMMKI